MDKFINSRPQRLCLMCGRCCRAATTYIPHEELLKMAQEGDEGAKDFLRIFDAYPSIEAAREVDSLIVDNLLEKLETAPEKPSKITFYRCKHILDNNLCGIYENNRPELCGRFPTSPWAIVPPKCGYEGWMFKYREELKQKIRKQKESLLELEAELKNDHSPEMKAKIEVGIQQIKDIVKAYSKYGSEDW